jgi:hypothetical protein
MLPIDTDITDITKFTDTTDIIEDITMPPITMFHTTKEDMENIREDIIKEEGVIEEGEDI